MDGHQKGEAATIMWPWARSRCAMGTWEGEGHWGEEGVLCYFQVQLLLKCNFVLQLRLASKLTSRRAGTHASPHKGFNDSLRIGTRSLLRVEWRIMTPSDNILLGGSRSDPRGPSSSLHSLRSFQSSYGQRGLLLIPVATLLPIVVNQDLFYLFWRLEIPLSHSERSEEWSLRYRNEELLDYIL